MCNAGRGAPISLPLCSSSGAVHPLNLPLSCTNNPYNPLQLTEPQEHQTSPKKPHHQQHLYGTPPHPTSTQTPPHTHTCPTAHHTSNKHSPQTQPPPPPPPAPTRTSAALLLPPASASSPRASPQLKRASCAVRSLLLADSRSAMALLLPAGRGVVVGLCAVVAGAWMDGLGEWFHATDASNVEQAC